MKAMIIFITFHIIFLNSCSTFSPNKENLDLEEEYFSEWSPIEIEKTTFFITESLSKYLKDNSTKPFLEFLKIDNKSSEHIDTSLIENELRTKFIKNKIIIIDKSKRKETLKEIELEMKGIVDEKSKLRAGYLLSPSFQLKGDINDLVTYKNGVKKQLLVINFTLLNLETNSIDWQASKKFKKELNTSTIGF